MFSFHLPSHVSQSQINWPHKAWHNRDSVHCCAFCGYRRDTFAVEKQKCPCAVPCCCIVWFSFFCPVPRVVSELSHAESCWVPPDVNQRFKMKSKDRCKSGFTFTLKIGRQVLVSWSHAKICAAIWDDKKNWLQNVSDKHKNHRNPTLESLWKCVNLPLWFMNSKICFWTRFNRQTEDKLQNF